MEATPANRDLLRKALKDPLAIELVDAHGGASTPEERQKLFRRILEQRLAEKRRRLAGDGSNKLA